MRPIEIQQDHLNRLAVVYCCLATMESTPEARPRVEVQRDQIRFARKWGWPESTIMVMDGDIGRSGLKPEGRTDFQRLYTLIQVHQVGLVLVSELSRIGRSSIHFQKFTALCREAETLIAVAGTLWQPPQPDVPIPSLQIPAMDENERFMYQITSDVAEYEDAMRRAWM
jgi:hypothetical protein